MTRGKIAKKRMTGELPVCNTLVLCDKVVIGNDLVATVVRIVDTVGVHPDENRKIGDMVGIGGVSIFVSVKNGRAKGKFNLILDCVDPTQKRTRMGHLEFTTHGDEQRGSSTVAPLGVRWGGEGVYWHELKTADGAVLGRSPFKLIVGTPEEIEKILRAEIKEAANISKNNRQKK